MVTSVCIDVTVIIPTLNAGTTLGASLAALSQASRFGIRVCIVDGGSVDDTLSIAEEHGVAILHHDGGLYAALNAGFHHAETTWLTWINADDLLHATMLPLRLASAGDADVLYGLVDYIDAQGRFLHAWRSAAPRDLPTLYRAGYSPLLQQGTLFRRSLFQRVGGFDESFKFVGDADFWWRCLDAGGRFHEQHGPPVAAFRLHAGQISQRHHEEMRAEHISMVRRRGLQPRVWSAFWPAARFRTRNWSRYVVRCLRPLDFGESPRLVAGYDIRSTDDLGSPSA